MTRRGKNERSWSLKRKSSSRKLKRASSLITKKGQPPSKTRPPRPSAIILWRPSLKLARSIPLVPKRPPPRRPALRRRVPQLDRPLPGTGRRRPGLLTATELLALLWETAPIGPMVREGRLRARDPADTAILAILHPIDPMVKAEAGPLAVGVPEAIRDKAAATVARVPAGTRGRAAAMALRVPAGTTGRAAATALRVPAGTTGRAAATALRVPAGTKGRAAVTAANAQAAMAGERGVPVVMAAVLGDLAVTVDPVAEDPAAGLVRDRPRSAQVRPQRESLFQDASRPSISARTRPKRRFSLRRRPKLGQWRFPRRSTSWSRFPSPSSQRR
jgi:hypothetical protein